MDSNIDLTCSPKYKMPNDPANKLAISINYYIPKEFTKNRGCSLNNRCILCQICAGMN